MSQHHIRLVIIGPQCKKPFLSFPAKMSFIPAAIEQNKNSCVNTTTVLTVCHSMTAVVYFIAYAC